MGARGLLILDFKRQETETWTKCTLDAFKQHFQTLAFGSGGDVFGSYCNTFPVVVWMFLVVSSQFLCEFPAVFVDFAVQTTHQVPLGPERLGRVPSCGPARQHGGPLGRGRRTCGDARWLDVHHIIGLEDV